MPVKVRCPSCEKVLNVPDTARGKAVKCPGCEGRVPVPAESEAAAAPAKTGAVKTAAKSAPVRKKADDDDSFLSGLDLSKAEDSSVKACKKCGAKLDEEDEECPKCGTMVGTGQLSKSARKARSKGRGPDQDLFFKYFFKDAWGFYKKNFGLALRSSMITVGFGTVALLLFVAFSWCAMLPPKMFCLALAFIIGLVPFGWLWFLMTEIIKGTMEKKEKLKRVNFDLFLCIALGFKFLLWMFVFFLPIWIVAGILGMVLAMSGNAIIASAVSGLLGWCWSVLVPPALTHMAMPVQMRGWLSPMVFPIFGKVWKPSLYCLIMWMLVMVPINAIMGGLVFVGGSGFGDAIVALNEGGEIKREEVARESDKKAAAVAQADKREPPKVDWVRMILPTVMYVLCMGIAPLGVVLCMRPIGQFAYYFRKDLDLVTSAPEHVYVARRGGREVHGTGPANPMQLGLTVTGVLVFLPFMAGWLALGLTQGIMAGLVVGGIAAAVMLPFALVMGGLYVIFEKAGESGATLFVPIYGPMQMAKVAGRPAWWGLIPVLQIIISADIAKRFGKGPLYQIGCILLPYIFFPLLGFTGEVYDDGSRKPVRSDDDDDDDDDDDEDDHH